MGAAPGNSPSLEISAAGIATDTLGPNGPSVQCVNVASCTAHVGSHCPPVVLKQYEPIISHQSNKSETLSIGTITVASIDFPKGLFRPPIV